MTGFHLCKSCDALRDSESAWCASCDAITQSYLYYPSEREEFELLAQASQFVRAVPHNPHGFSIQDAA